jgi:hypothetical protein
MKFTIFGFDNFRIHLNLIVAPTPKPFSFVPAEQLYITGYIKIILFVAPSDLYISYWWVSKVHKR